MKSYPSILRSTGQNFREISMAYCFDKLDGSNLRFEWSRKQGWYKFGTRNRLFDDTDPQFGPAIPKFLETMSEHLAGILRKERWESAVVFCEYWGPTTLGGLHTAQDDHSKKVLTLFDVAPYKKGLLGPRQFLDLFEDWEHTVRCFGRHNWTRGLVDQVRSGKFHGITFEGLVGKAGDGASHDLVMAKAKTQAWIDAILARYGEEAGTKLIES